MDGISLVFFSREGLLEIMDTIDFSTIGLSDIPCYAACFNLKEI